MEKSLTNLMIFIKTGKANFQVRKFYYFRQKFL